MMDTPPPVAWVLLVVVGLACVYIARSDRPSVAGLLLCVAFAIFGVLGSSGVFGLPS